MTRLLPALIIAGVIVLALALMWWGWRGRQRRQASLAPLQPVPAEAGSTVLAISAFYVATTERDNPLERIAVGGLGYRARATVGVRERGIELAIPGQDALFIPFAEVESVFRARHTIDRAVERDGLVVLRYRIGDSVVDSYFRIVDSAVGARFVDAVASRVSKATAP